MIIPRSKDAIDFFYLLNIDLSICLYGWIGTKKQVARLNFKSHDIFLILSTPSMDRWLYGMFFPTLEKKKKCLSWSDMVTIK